MVALITRKYRSNYKVSFYLFSRRYDVIDCLLNPWQGTFVHNLCYYIIIDHPFYPMLTRQKSSLYFDSKIYSTPRISCQRVIFIDFIIRSRRSGSIYLSSKRRILSYLGTEWIMIVIAFRWTKVTRITRDLCRLKHDISFGGIELESVYF